MKKRTTKVTPPAAPVYPKRTDGLKQIPASTGSPYTVLVVENGQPANSEQIIAMSKHITEQLAQPGRKHAAPSMPQPSTTTKETSMATKTAAAAAPAAPAAAAAAPKKGALKFGAPASAPTKPAKATKDVGDPSKHHSANAKGAKAAAATTAPAAPAKAAKAPKPAQSPAKAAKAAAVANGSYKVAANPTKSGMSKDFLDAASKLKKFNRDELLTKGGTKACGGDAARAARFFSYFVTKGVFVPA